MSIGETFDQKNYLTKFYSIKNSYDKNSILNLNFFLPGFHLLKSFYQNSICLKNSQHQNFYLFLLTLWPLINVRIIKSLGQGSIYIIFAYEGSISKQNVHPPKIYMWFLFNYISNGSSFNYCKKFSGKGSSLKNYFMIGLCIQFLLAFHKFYIWYFIYYMSIGDSLDSWTNFWPEFHWLKFLK